MEHISNEEKAREIANDCCTHICLADCSAESYFGSENDCYKAAMEAMSWKDKERKELWRITRNRWQEWAIEQLTAFAQHLQKHGAFRDDLCMDFEHEAQSFIELQKPKKL
jgi:hypothetical protein